VRVVVTGGAGFIGSTLVDLLVAQGDEVIVVDHLARGHISNLRQAVGDGVEVIAADVANMQRMTAALGRVRPEVVYHLAAQIDVRSSVADPSTDAHVNVGGTAAVLEAARAVGVRRVVLASTAAVYGDPVLIPTPEHAEIVPLSPYGASKAAAETYMSMFARLHGLSTICLRMSNVYGPRQDPHGEAGVIAIFCAASVKGDTVTMFGDGTQTRDYVYVGDVARAFAAAGASDVEGTVNISTGRETPLLNLVRALDLDTRTAPARAGETRRSCLDPGLAAKRLGWDAEVPFAEGLGMTLEHLKAATKGQDHLAVHARRRRPHLQ